MTLRSPELALKKLCLNLAQQVVVDGEGARKFLTVRVINAKSLSSAKNISFAIANSPLVKTAIAGEDPNWGRIIMALGKSGLDINLNKLSIKFGDLTIINKGKIYNQKLMVRALCIISDNMLILEAVILLHSLIYPTINYHV